MLAANLVGINANFRISVFRNYYQLKNWFDKLYLVWLKLFNVNYSEKVREVKQISPVSEWVEVNDNEGRKWNL